MPARTLRHALRRALEYNQGDLFALSGRVREQALVPIGQVGLVEWTGEEAELAAMTLAKDLKGLGQGAFVRGETVVVLDGTVSRGLLQAMIRRYTFVATPEIR